VQATGLRWLGCLPLNNAAVCATHPDRVGGLGFLADTVYAFIPLLIAHGALLAGLIFDRIYHIGAKLPDCLTDMVSLTRAKETLR
jgi:hypothetical protein